MKKFLFAFSALALSLSAIPTAFANGGPYAVDDAGIATPGKFKLEAWSSFANNGDRVYLVSPGFTLEALPFIEFELTAESRRADGEWATTFAPAAKIALRDIDEHGYGLALSIGSGHAGVIRNADTLYAVVPLSVPVNDRLNLHFNAGVERDLTENETVGVWGMAAQVMATDRLELIGEVFGAENDRPGWQAGIRPYVFDGNVALEIVYGRNLDGERADWLTLGLSFEF
ncbi:MAG: hypothetical protein JJU26_02885 [Oceanicaulis sp.]|uniref:hypothetical protein n=1 Tax=Glycocaulis sp. TaxID=1969725 RepID=UPI0025C241CD|nr:hypothetical protein [Glycocaulis sp.]MCC5980645.1 hypothetical protein [Oceanicaulis sp.]MCH8520610.1 hypothetical protein [Glycocaulis sp.]